MDILHRIEKILTAPTVEDVWAHYVERVATYGFPHLIYSGHRLIGAIDRRVIDDGLALSSLPLALSSELMKHKMCRNLPMLSWIMQNKGSQSWNWLHHRRSDCGLSDDEILCFELLHRHGHGAGVAMSLSDRVPRVRAGLLLMGPLGISQDRINSLWKSCRREVEILTTAMHQRLSNLPYREPVHSLTSRQREALELTGAGLTTQEIADQLVVTPGTVEKHLRLARKALGARTTAQAVLLAMSRRQIFVDPGDNSTTNTHVEDAPPLGLVRND